MLISTALVAALVLGPQDDPNCPHDHAAELEAQADAPPGFPARDEFADIASACEGLVPRLVEREDLREPVLEWCLARAHYSSRMGRVRSRLDGSWIHDRDRPTARTMYRRGLKTGALDPEACEHHAVDLELRRDRAAQSFPWRWPYATYCDRQHGECRPSCPGRMLEAVAERWLDRAPDFERFGTRGPIDNNAAVGAKYLGGCWPPEQLDRFDVAAAVTIERSEDLCLRLEARLDTRVRRKAARDSGLPTSCRTARDLQSIWHPRFWYERLRWVLSRAR